MKIFKRARFGDRYVRIRGETWNLLCDWVESLANMRTAGGIVFRSARTGSALALELAPGIVIARSGPAGIPAAADDDHPGRGVVYLRRFTGVDAIGTATNEEVAYNLATDPGDGSGAVGADRNLVCGREWPSGNLLVLWELCP